MPSAPLPSRVRSLAPSLLPLLVLLAAGLHAARFWDFLSDDALISLRYAQRLDRGLGLTWTDGEAVEGYSDLLWVLLAAGLGKLGLDLVLAVRLLGGVGLVLAVAAASADPSDSRRRSSARWLAGGGSAALTAGLAIWAVGGLEHTLVAGLACWAVVALCRVAERRDRAATWAAAGLLGAIALLRTDGFVLCGGALLGGVLAIGPREAARRLWPVAVVVVALLSAQMAFRVGYYGDWIPNTARVKVALTQARIVHGLEWTGTALLHHAALLASAVAASLALRDSPRIAIAGCTAAAWCAYVAFVGGDIFPGWRQLVPALPLLSFLAAEGLDRLRWRDGAKVALAAVGLALHAASAARGESTRVALIEHWEWDGRPLGRAMATAWGDLDPLLAVDAAGATPYWSGFDALDMLGLTDAWLPRHPPPGFGDVHIGHDLGDGGYIWRRKPDLILFNSSTGNPKPKRAGGRQLLAMPAFRKTYFPLRVRASEPGLRVVAYFYGRRTDGPLGVRSSPDRVIVPGWWLSGEGSLPATLDEAGRMTGNASAESAAHLPSLSLARGTWRLVAPPGLRADVRCAGRSASRREPFDPEQAVIEVGREAAVDLLLWPAGEERVRIEEIRLERTTDPPSYACGPPLTAPLSAVDRVEEDARWDAPGALVMRAEGAVVTLPELSHATQADVSLDCNDDYRFEWLAGGERLAATDSPPVSGSGLVHRTVEVPPEVAAQGFDAVKIVPSGGDRMYSLGHLRLR